MVVRRSGTNLDRESVRVRLPSSLTRRLGNAMRSGPLGTDGYGGRDAAIGPLYGRLT
jgi:hypothetical protein